MVAAGLAACGGADETAPTGASRARVDIEICAPDCRTVSTEIAAGGSVVDALEAAEAAGALDARWRGAGATAFVTSIDGVDTPDPQGRWWILSVNGEDACVGPGVLSLAEGDAVSWRLAKGADADCG